jgi:predicted nucleic acid-binding protein
MSLFVDTSIWYAAADSSDRSNARAKDILKSGEGLITSDQVLVETWTLLHHKLQRRAAERFWDGLRSGIAIIEAVGPADLEVLGRLVFTGVTKTSPS